jgi:hypothetical protein
MLFSTRTGTRKNPSKVYRRTTTISQNRFRRKFSHFFLTAVVREISLFLFSGSGAFTIRHKMVAEKLGLACEVQSKPGST